MVVAVGLTLIEAPLVMVRLPGVMTPEPFENTAVRLALAPGAMVAGLALKLAMAGAGLLLLPPPEDEPPPQPVSDATDAKKIAAHRAETQQRLMTGPLKTK